ncbi:hypothetical protein [Herbihabitans rhizosphaerae]|uniref:hypothetical protein n=1 Tax=Herbihabitans rhizosphaerae TaxID=1872711 RepID=UPI00102C2FA0|nr:hypothetical protein [Herbihabitans rhizosphaerae]
MGADRTEPIGGRRTEALVVAAMGVLHAGRWCGRCVVHVVRVGRQRSRRAAGFRRVQAGREVERCEVQCFEVGRLEEVELVRWGQEVEFVRRREEVERLDEEFESDQEEYLDEEHGFDQEGDPGRPEFTQEDELGRFEFCQEDRFGEVERGEGP